MANQSGTQKKSPRYRRWIRDIVLIILVFAAVGAIKTRNLIPTGEPLPIGEVTQFNGETMDFAALQGRPTLLVVWAPWCGVCGAESSNISRARKWLGDRANVVSMAVSYESRESVQKFMDKHDVDYPVIMGDEAIAQALRIRALPGLYALNKEGEIKHRTVGYTTTFGMLWRTLF